MVEYTLTSSKLADTVNQDEQLLEAERRFNTNLIGQYADKDIIPSLCWKKVGRQRRYIVDAKEWAVFGTRLLRYRDANRKKVGVIFRVAIKAWGAEKTPQQILERMNELFAEANHSYPLFVYNLNGLGLDLSEEVLSDASPPL